MRINRIIQKSTNKLEELLNYIGFGINNNYYNDFYQALHSRSTRATAANIEEYFINNGHRFNNPYVIQNIDNRNFAVKIYSRNLESNELSKVQQCIIRAFKETKRLLEISGNPQETQIIELYIFNNKDDYTYYGSKFGLGLANEGGKHYYIGRNNVLSKIYVYQDGDVHNLVHEIVHANIAYITNGNSIPTVISEGIANNIQHNLDEDSSTRGVSIDATRRKLIGNYGNPPIFNVNRE